MIESFTVVYVITSKLDLKPGYQTVSTVVLLPSVSEVSIYLSKPVKSPCILLPIQCNIDTSLMVVIFSPTSDLKPAYLGLIRGVETYY